MGTRSCVAIAEGDGFRGKYVHWDGYPTYMGKTLHTLVNERGLDEVQRVMVHESAGFSCLDPRKTELDDYEGDGRFMVVPGFGIGYNPDSEQGDVDDWITPFHNDESKRDSWGTAWAYVLSDGGLVVYHMSYRSAPTYVALIPWGAVDTDWEAVEAAAYADA
jgi:hypothetical protein